MLVAASDCLRARNLLFYHTHIALPMLVHHSLALMLRCCAFSSNLIYFTKIFKVLFPNCMIPFLQGYFLFLPPTFLLHFIMPFLFLLTLLILLFPQGFAREMILEILMISLTCTLAKLFYSKHSIL